MLRALPYVIPIGLAVYALIDLFRSLPYERGRLSRPVWALLILLLPVLGPVAWILLSRARRHEQGEQRPAPGRPARPARRTGPVAPDDDPDFLWRIERERQRREQRPAGEAPTDPASDRPTGPSGGAGSGDEPRTGQQPDAEGRDTGDEDAPRS